ncbi:MAG: hypothetical protein BRC26_01805 [Nanohaloarchaea archaeon QH_8_44_6]|nr:MAG: hypothetical protein BRC26_01805 [Nanohaloarchaea archaeon QH_8_44_6]
MSGKSIGGMLDKLPSLDIATMIVLGFDAYIIYTQVERFERDALFNISFDPFAIAFQVSVLLVLVYLIEFIHDKKKDSGGGLHR